MYVVTQILTAERHTLQPFEDALRRAARWTPSVGAAPAPPHLRRRDRSIVGRAFDWWLRGWCVRHRNAREEDTVLHRAAKRAEVRAPEVGVVLDAALADRARFLHCGLDSVAALENCIALARLEGAVRTGILADDPGAIALGDLRRLATAAEIVPFPLGRYVLGPQFGSGVIEGEGDVAVDGLLLDVKATADREPLLAWTQVASYVVLDLLEKKPRWDQLGLYAARYGALGVIDVPRVLPVITALGSFWKRTLRHVAAIGTEPPPTQGRLKRRGR